MNRRDFLRVSASTLLAASITACPNITPGVRHNSKPNILLIVADDLGWNDVDWHGSEIDTPNLNALGQSGVFLERNYVCPVCVPTRMGLVTGRFAQTVGWPTACSACSPDRYGLPQSEVTIAERLAREGYSRRALFGKWHLGLEDNEHPLVRGFTDFRGGVHGSWNYFTGKSTTQSYSGTPDWWDGYTTATPRDGYVTYDVGQSAIDFIHDRATEPDPWFEYAAFTAPHVPYHDVPVTPNGVDLMAKYEGLQTAEKPDEMIGHMIAALEETGQRDNTLILFMSDNGATSVIGKSGDNSPLRGGKNTTFEGGIRAPALISWPAEFAPGQVCDELTMYTDYAPTMLAAACGDLDATNFEGVPIGYVLANPGMRRAYSYRASVTLGMESVTVTQTDKTVHRYSEVDNPKVNRWRHILDSSGYIDETSNLWAT